MTDAIWPTRRFIDPDLRELPRDEFGFLHEDYSSATIRDLLASPHPILVTAPPDRGKTYVSERVRDCLRTVQDDPPSDIPFGKFFHMTSFEQHGTSESITPGWWDEWCQDGAARACWIIDAIDEDTRNNHRNAHAALNAIEQLDDTTRGRLKLLVLCRRNERSKKIEERIGGLLLGDRSAFGISHYELGPLTAGEAKLVAGSPENFDKALQLIRGNNLQAIAERPKSIETLVGWPEGESATEEEVWHQMLVGMVSPAKPKLLTEPIERIHAVGRIAVVLSLSGQEEVRHISAVASSPSVDEIFPMAGELRKAAYEALNTEVFVRTATGYKFARHHVQERFAAYELQSLEPTKLRPLIVDSDGQPLQRHAGIHALLLNQGSGKHKTIVATAYGGVPPKSDTWTLSDSVRFVDSLLDKVRQSPYGLPLLDDDISFINVAGFSRHIAQQIRNKDLSENERDFLIDIAKALRLRSAVAACKDIIVDDQEPDGLRVSCGYYISSFGTSEDFQSLSDFARNLAPDRDKIGRIKSLLLTGIFRFKLWPFAEIVSNVPRHFGDAIDATSMVVYKLKTEMTTSEARELLQSSDLNQLVLGEDESRSDVRHQLREDGPLDILQAAVVKCVDSGALSQDDFEMLLPVALGSYYTVLSTSEMQALIGAYRANTDARRMLFEASHADDPLPARRMRRLDYVLNSGDCHWLVDFIERRNTRDPDLLDIALALANENDDVTAEEIAARIEDLAPGFPEGFAQRREQARLAEEELEREHQKDQPEEYALVELVEEALGDSDFEPLARLHRLSSLCFASFGTRYNNVIGHWDDLSVSLKQRVIEALISDLQEADSTEIPDGNSFSSGILWEGDAFGYLLSNHHESVTTTMIQKWLPALLRTSTDSNAESILKCFAIDPDSTESAVLQEIRRSIRSGNVGPTLVSEIPAEAWTSALTDHVVGIINDSEVDIKYRVAMFESIRSMSPSVLIDTANEWAVAGDEDPEIRLAKRRSAIAYMFSVDPPRAVELLREYVSDGTDLPEINIFRGMDNIAGVDFGSWPTETIETLIGIIYESHPPSADPARPSGVARLVTGFDRIREFRGNLVELLIARNEPDGNEALERLSSQHEDISRRYAYVVAARRAQEVVQLSRPTSMHTDLERGDIPADKLVRLLDSIRYRLVRSDEDLLSILTSELRGIEQDTLHHLPMLYQHTKNKDAKRTRLQEDALQSYVHCRLKDRLPDKVLDKDTHVWIDPETQEARKRRFDVKVRAFSIGGSEITVVIEIKWSDNRTVGNALYKQLGQKYLVEDKPKAGIYLVGWNGELKWPDGMPGRPTKPHTPRKLATKLLQQRNRFVKAHPEVAIEPIVMDLSWPMPDKTQKKAGSRNRKKKKPAKKKAKKKVVKKKNIKKKTSKRKASRKPKKKTAKRRSKS